MIKINNNQDPLIDIIEGYKYLNESISSLCNIIIKENQIIDQYQKSLQE